ncbi:MAG: EamA family transporter RarD [Steroidobacteraceae bacterium]
MTDPANRADADATRPTGSSGLAAAVTAFAMWGVFPLYLKPLSGVPALQVMSHRIVWCCVVVFGWLAARNELSAVGAALRRPAIRWRLAASAVCISVNWLIYTWAVTNGHVVDASLGYFINPLVSVVLGVVVLHERLNRVQWTAVALAGAGVLYLAIALGRPPWIAIALASSFGLYGLIRKVVHVDSVPGLATETLLVVPFAAAYLVWCESHGSGALGHSTTLVNVLLLLSGVVTATPLALFAYGARRIPLSMVGLVQYIGPTMQFLIGVFVFGEAFPPARAVGFAMIWSALVVYAGDGLLRRRSR